MPGSRMVVTKSEEADRADIYSGGRPTVHVWCLVMGNDSCLSGTSPLIYSPLALLSSLQTRDPSHSGH